MQSLNLKPNSRYLAKLITIYTLIALLVFIVATVLGSLIAMEEGSRAGGIFMTVFYLIDAAFWLVAVGLSGPYYRSLAYEIRDDEIIVRVGIWTKSVKHVPFRTVTNVQIARGILDRFLFNLGTLSIQTAGMSGSTGAEESLVGLADVHGAYEVVATRLRAFRGAMSPTGGSDAVVTADDGTMAAMLAELKAIRGALER